MPPLKLLLTASTNGAVKEECSATAVVLHADHDAGAEDAGLSTTEAKDRDADAVEEDEGNKADGGAVQVNHADCAVESDESRAGEEADRRKQEESCLPTVVSLHRRKQETSKDAGRQSGNHISGPVRRAARPARKSSFGA